LNHQWYVPFSKRGKHARNQIARDLRSDDIVGHTELHLAGVILCGQEAKQTVIDSVDVFAVLVAVVKTSCSQLRELALKTLQYVNAEELALAPVKVLYGESVGCIWSTFVVAVDDMNVFELVIGVDLRILGAADVRHVAPVIGRCEVWQTCRSGGRVEDKVPKHASAIDNIMRVEVESSYCRQVERYGCNESGVYADEAQRARLERHDWLESKAKSGRRRESCLSLNG
ncbi:hypothetical protein KCU85_g500, partial [Aureobasidium melanogenum]